MVLSARPDWRLRSPAPGDFESYVAMIEARTEALHAAWRMTRAGWEEWWGAQSERLSRDMQVAEIDGGRLVGAGGVEAATEPFVMIPVWASVHPEFWRRDEVWDALYAWAEDRALSYVDRAPSGAQVDLLAEASEADSFRQAALGRAGFTLSRIFFRMAMVFDGVVRVPCAGPSGITIRPFELERDLLDVARVHNEAFRDHWGHADESPEAFAEGWRRDTAGHRADLGLVAEAGGTTVGYLVCQDNYGGDDTRALIDYLGVLREWRQRGIARALLETILYELQQEGYKGARLGVDASSPTGALRLYESVGMHMVEQVNRYGRLLRPGVDQRSFV